MRTGRQCRGLGWDHPRVGGEKRWVDQTTCVVLGSPPRGRGKAFSVLRRQFRFRITPAWAGKRTGFPAGRHPDRDHPRVGGEKPEWAPITFLMLGSPPHGRGKALPLYPAAPLYGITPAWAGKRCTRSPPSGSSRDHPRMGGEKQMEQGAGRLWVGSPPHRRGKVGQQNPVDVYIRITPAWAGKSAGIKRALAYM